MINFIKKLFKIKSFEEKCAEYNLPLPTDPRWVQRDGKMISFDWEISFVLENLQCLCHLSPSSYFFREAKFYYNLTKLDVPNSLAFEYKKRMIAPILQAQREKELAEILKAKEGLKRLCNTVNYKDVSLGAFAPHTYVLVDNLK